MTHYIGIVHKDDDSGYGIGFPDLPGCFSAGEDLIELERNAIEAIELYLEDQDAADFPARDMNQIVADGLVDADNHMLMAVPYLRSGGRAVRVNISIDAHTLAAIDEAARRRKLSRSAFLVSAVQRELTGAH